MRWSWFIFINRMNQLQYSLDFDLQWRNGGLPVVCLYASSSCPQDHMSDFFFPIRRI